MFHDLISASFLRAVALAIPIFALACAEDSEKEPGGQDLAADAGDGDAIECVLQADGACPDGCVSLTGTPLDKDKECWLGEATIGCATKDGAFPDELGCYVDDATGTVYETPNLYPLGSRFRDCSDEERELMFATEDACE